MIKLYLLYLLLFSVPGPQADKTYRKNYDTVSNRYALLKYWKLKTKILPVDVS